MVVGIACAACSIWWTALREKVSKRTFCVALLAVRSFSASRMARVVFPRPGRAVTRVERSVALSNSSCSGMVLYGKVYPLVAGFAVCEGIQVGEKVSDLVGHFVD